MSEHPSDEAFQAYLDDELAQPERREFEAHFPDCPDCAAELTRLRSLFLSIESLPSEPLTTDLVPGVMAAVRPRANWLPSLALGELLTAAALTLVLVVWFGGGELQARLDGAVQRSIEQLQVIALDLSTAINDLIGQVPELPRPDMSELGDLVGTALASPSVLWAAGAAALVLLLLGNGLVLSMGKDRNA